MKNKELHRTHRIGWLRAAVLGANDGIVSTASLIVGVAACRIQPQHRLACRYGRVGSGGNVDGRR